MGSVGGQHHCSPEMGVMKDSALRTIFSPLRSVGVYKTYPFLCTFLAAVFNMNIFLNFEQCGVLLAWLVVIRVQFSQICFSRRGCGGGERKLGQTNRHSRHFSTQPPKPRWRTRELKNKYRNTECEAKIKNTRAKINTETQNARQK